MSTHFALGAVLGLGGMEAASYAMHRYLFHGVLWRIHLTHHRPRRAVFELNDVFSLSFAGVAVGLLLAGGEAPLESWATGVGTGMSLFGVTYFLLHDLLAHGRFGVGRSWAARAPRVLARLALEHRKHHRSLEKPGLPPYGFLNV
jgi:beta-carotene 3-hydroxylase